MHDRPRKINGRWRGAFFEFCLDRKYLDALPQGKIYPPSSSSNSSLLATLPLSGRRSSALAGVDGMDGARRISMIANSQKDRAGRQRDAGTNSPNTETRLTPLSLHVISRREGSRLPLVAFTTGGLCYVLHIIIICIVPNETKVSGLYRESLTQSAHGELPCWHYRLQTSKANRTTST